MKIIVLGSGLVGSVIAEDLFYDGFEVTATDFSQDSLNRIKKRANIETRKLDFSDLELLKATISDFDVVVSAVPGSIGHRTLKAIIEAGKDAVDIAFAAEDFMLLAPLARQKGVTAICDFGVAPGMSNLLAAWLSKQLSPAESVSIYVGGLPKIRKWPFEYKAVFSPSDLVEEYTRPARFIKDGKLVVKPALTDLEIIEFEDIGSLEAFNSDGLRSLLDTLQVPDMIEKTLRYPGHIHKVEVLRDAGFLNSEPIDVNGQKVSPAGLTGKLLFPKLDLEAGEQDITVMRVEAKGYREGKPVCLRYDLFDSYCNETGHHSMGRTTGYAATMAVRMLTEKKFGEKGVIAPEMLANNDFLVKYILKGLAEKGINYRFSEFDL